MGQAFKEQLIVAIAEVIHLVMAEFQVTIVAISEQNGGHNDGT
jgi:hypothetical protein